LVKLDLLVMFNLIDKKSQGRWITAKRICIKFMSDSENKKKARIVEFAAGRMMKDEYKVCARFSITNSQRTTSNRF